MIYDNGVYGYVNGKAFYSRNEYIYACRHFGPIENDKELIEFALKKCGKRKLTDMWRGDYALDHPKCDLTNDEYKRLKWLQAVELKRLKEEDKAREWKLTGRFCYADNSVEEEWTDKDGNKKIVMVVYPHGD